MYNDLVLAILEIIDYKENKEEFAADFNRVINSQALVALMQTLPEEKRDEADALIASSDSAEKFTQNVHKYFTDEQVQEALDNAAVSAITEWLRSLHPTLSEEQREKLMNLSDQLEKMISS